MDSHLWQKLGIPKYILWLPEVCVILLRFMMHFRFIMLLLLIHNPYTRTWLNVGRVKALAHIYPLRVAPAFYLQATLPCAHVFEHYTSL